MSKSNFPAADPKKSINQHEQETLAFWEKNNVPHHRVINCLKMVGMKTNLVLINLALAY